MCRVVGPSICFVSDTIHAEQARSTKSLFGIAYAHIMSGKSKIIPPNVLITNRLIWNANAKKKIGPLIETRLAARFSKNAGLFPTRSLLQSSASHTRDLDRERQPAPSSLPPATGPPPWLCPSTSSLPPAASPPALAGSGSSCARPSSTSPCSTRRQLLPT